ncbi:hypothetical protein [Microbispora triticiradicis]|uniref:hypothetical protein n=1 Tax=Microbispora triticiradicis TaxID=2200763 RepID=UPI001AD63F98|nr:hypothetical protein [Microbispora triticiradicis]MBO4273750.1 hypothetical protein [Microbispora triticiradicis]
MSLTGKVRVLPLSAALVAGLLALGTAAPAHASLPPKVCVGTVTSLGEGMWVRAAPGYAAAPLYQLHEGQVIEWLRAGGTADGIAWHARTYDAWTNSGEYVPIRVAGTTAVYVQVDYCDGGA